MIINLPQLEPILQQKSISRILESKQLAQLGDFLINFVYTAVRMGVKGVDGSIHVWDYSLRKAMDRSKLRKKLRRNLRPDRVADAAEAFIAYCYLHEIMRLDHMVLYLSRRLNPEDFEIPKIEREAAATAIGELLERLVYLAYSSREFQP